MHAYLHDRFEEIARCELLIDLFSLSQCSKAKAQDAIFYSYTKHINGFAANLDAAEAAEIASQYSLARPLNSWTRNLLLNVDRRLINRIFLVVI